MKDITFERTALLSVERDHTNAIEMVKLLLKNGANSAAQDKNGRDILCNLLWDDEPLCFENFKNLVKYLISGPTAPGWEKKK